VKILYRSSVEKFLNSLDIETQAKTERAVELLEDYGHNLGMPHSKKVEKGIYELRVLGKKKVRLLYATKKRRAYLLHGFIKKTRKIPKKELDIARWRFKILATI
jgi:phage-related protein